MGCAAQNCMLCVACYYRCFLPSTHSISGQIKCLPPVQEALLDSRERLFDLAEQSALAEAAGMAGAAAIAAEGGEEGILASVAAAVAEGNASGSAEVRAALDQVARLEKEVGRNVF